MMTDQTEQEITDALAALWKRNADLDADERLEALRLKTKLRLIIEAQQAAMPEQTVFAKLALKLGAPR